MSVYHKTKLGKLYLDNSLNISEILEPKSIDMCITSPPYWALRNYTNDEELGQETHLNDYIDNLVSIFNHIYPILKSTGSLWVVIGDTYYSKSKGTGGKTKKQLTNSGSFFQAKRFESDLLEKSLCNIPARFSIAMQDTGWILRNDIIWHKPNAWVTSAKNRFTVDYEHVYWFTKIPKGYYFKQQFEPFSDKTKWNPIRIKDGDSSWDKNTGQETHRARNYRPNVEGRNKRAVWSINTKSVFGMKHHAKFPEKLLESPIDATCPLDGIILDPFMGSGTTAVVSEKMNRHWVGIEIVEDYCKDIIKRLEN